MKMECWPTTPLISTNRRSRCRLTTCKCEGL